MNSVTRRVGGTQYLWTCQHIGVNQYGTNDTPAADRTAIEWFKIQLQSNPFSANIVDSGRIFDSAPTSQRFFYYPSLAVNNNGDLVIGFSRSSVNHYISVFYPLKRNNCWA